MMAGKKHVFPWLAAAAVASAALAANVRWLVVASPKRLGYELSSWDGRACAVGCLGGGILLRQFGCADDPDGALERRHLGRRAEPQSGNPIQLQSGISRQRSDRGRRNFLQRYLGGGIQL